MIMKHAVVEGSEYFNHKAFFNMHLNLDTAFFPLIKNVAAAAGIGSRNLQVGS